MRRDVGLVRRRILSTGVGLMWGVVAVLIAAGNASWACVPQPLLTVLPRSSGPSGAQVTLEGLHFTGAVEIRWNAVDGPLVANATGAPFSVVGTIPDATAGLYALIAFERDPAGGIVGVTRSAFEVTGEGPPASKPVASRAAPPPPRSDTSSSTAFAAGLGAVGGFVLLAAGASWGARWERRRKGGSISPSDLNRPDAR